MSIKLVEKAEGICERSGINALKAPIARLLALRSPYGEIDFWIENPNSKKSLSNMLNRHDAEIIFGAARFIIQHMDLVKEKYDKELSKAKQLCLFLIDKYEEYHSMVDTFTFYNRFLDFQLYDVCRAGESKEFAFASDTFDLEVALKELESFFYDDYIDRVEMGVIADGFKAINEFKKEVDKNSSYRRRISYS
jgi:hypothetical protein